MRAVTLKKGYDIDITGAPADEIRQLPTPDRVALQLELFTYLKLKAQVEVGESVSVGSLLVADKNNPRIQFLSPGGGTVEAIDLGPRRVIKQVVVQLTPDESQVSFPKIDQTRLKEMSAKEVTEKLMQGGVWPYFKALPFRQMPSADTIPPALVVPLDSRAPFQPDAPLYLKNREKQFGLGLNILKQLKIPEIYVTSRHHNLLENLPEGIIPVLTRGPYPANDPGVTIYKVKSGPALNKSWYLHGADLVKIAHLFESGSYPVEQTLVLAGECVKTPQTVQTRTGVPVATLIKGQLKDNATPRFIAGDLFNGLKITKDDFMPFGQAALQVVPEGNGREFLAFVSPGIKKASYSRAFLSAFSNTPLSNSCNMHGGHRACIACGYCEEVCPVDIFPQLAYKSILADAVEEYLAHGLLDCVDCGLCSYVCPAKINLCQTLADAKSAYKKEISG